MHILQLIFGYLLGRLLVSLLIIPAYYSGNLETAYGYPLDIEFGIEASRLWVLQARPVPIAHAILAETVERYPLVSKDHDTHRRHDDPGAGRPLQGVAHDPT